MQIQSKLARFDLTMMVVSFVIGIGIFKTPGIIAEAAGTPVVFYSAWVIGGVISLLGALTFAEIGSRLPVAGGFYKIFSHCYDPTVAFMFNWAIVIVYAGGAVAMAFAGVDYIKPVIIPAQYMDAVSNRLMVVIMLTTLFVLNFMGIRMGARVQNLLSGIKIVAILVFCLAAFGHTYTAPQVHPAQSPFDAVKALGICLISVFFTYNGYQMTVNLGADIKDARRNIPRAIFSGVVIIFLLYIMINIAYSQVLGFENLKKIDQPAAQLAGRFFGDIGSSITSVVIFMSVFGFLNVLFISNPRVYHAMATDNILPPVFKRVNTRTQTQEVAITFFYALTMVSLLFFGTFKRVQNYITFIDCLAIAFAAATIFVLRRRQSDYTGFKVKFFPVVPIVFITVLLVVCVSVFVSDSTSALISIGIFAAGFPIYHLIRISMKRTAANQVSQAEQADEIQT